MKSRRCWKRKLALVVLLLRTWWQGTLGGQYAGIGARRGAVPGGRGLASEGLMGPFLGVLGA